MRADEFVRRFISVHKCAGCGEILEYKYSENALCPRCTDRWNRVVIADCNTCFKPIYKCTCMTKRLSKSGALCHRKLFEYKKDSAGVSEMRLLYTHKRFKIARVTRFISSQLAAAISEECAVLSPNEGDFLITHVPRTKRSYRIHGFDQSQRLASKLSEDLNICHMSVFKSSLRAKAQKDLNARERFENARKSIHLKKGVDLSGKYVILVDDIVTTGSQMAVCTELLRGVGARGVLCFSIATENKM